MSDQKNNYRDTLNLPGGSFSMKANLIQREPQQQKVWESRKVYERIQQAKADCPLYVLHDGPPYANGDIHMGHVINKVLKDIVVKYRTMAGFRAPYVPGWDCHGLPIEAKVVGELGEKVRTMSKLEIRRLCAKYASKYVKLQTNQFKALGVFGDFENPYLTLKPKYEQGICEVFAELVGRGLVYKQLKPIHWSIGCETALADAELEYKDIESPSIFVNFPATNESTEKLKQLGLVQKDETGCVSFMIWTTTPWTLAANLAIVAHPDLEYKTIAYKHNGKRFVSVVAASRIDAVTAAGKLSDYQISDTAVRGKALEGLRYNHPFVQHNPTECDVWMVALGSFVTTEDGTGLVHCAPGHGQEDYATGIQYGLAVYSPVMDDGRYDNTVPDWLKGKKVLEVDVEIIKQLDVLGLLFAHGKLMHSYPHCWRSRLPVIFRATEQWFISVDKPLPDTGKSLRQMALEQCKNVEWVPAWGQKRIEGMLESRPDWCISRQRSWGMPIPVFYNSAGDVLLTKESVLRVAKHIGKKGSDSWFIDSPREILGEDFPLPEGFTFDDLKKEENIFDVWFESGVSWYSVAKQAGWPVPVDLYLEGSDQHRGWFQLSLLPCLGANKTAPFKTVLTHGFTVDAEGRKQSKSLGNYVNAQDEVGKYGADVLRLWVASVNYQEDMRCSDELIGRLQDVYRKIRNTVRYMLSNIDDFEPARHAVAYKDMRPIDRWAMQQIETLKTESLDAYDKFLFHRVYSLVYNFCTVEMSSIYMDVLKDRLYCDGANSLSRRSAQTVLYCAADTLARMLAPILVHTAEEIWSSMKFKTANVDSIHLASLPKPDKTIDCAGEQDKWQKLMALRDEVLRELEGLRKNEIIASNQEASVIVNTGDAETIKLFEDFGLENFAALCIVSEVRLEKKSADKLVCAIKSPYAKCQRCWNYWPSVGKNGEYPDLCSRCVDVVKNR